MTLNTDETLNKIKQVNQRLSDLVGLEYTDFYRPERFVSLFELLITNADEYERVDTISDYLSGYLSIGFFNRISFIDILCDVLEEHSQKGGLYDIDKKLIRAIQREFRGLDDNKEA